MSGGERFNSEVLDRLLDLGHVSNVVWKKNVSY